MAESAPDFRKRGKIMGKEAMLKKVRHAVVTDDAEALRTWGARGGEATAKKKAERRDLHAYFDEKKSLEDQALRESANEHIVPIDPDDMKEAA
jgi:hypothetical protein